MKRVFILLVFCIFLIGCAQAPKGINSGTPNDLLIKSSGDSLIKIVDTIPEQKHSFTIKNAEVKDESLEIILEFSNDCENIAVELYSTAGQGFMESAPVQTNIYTTYESFDDYCDASVTEENFVFDLMPLIEYYEESYGRRDEIILNIIASDIEEQLFNLMYVPKK